MTANEVAGQVRDINENCHGVTSHAKKVKAHAEGPLDVSGTLTAITEALGVLAAIQNDALPEAREDASAGSAQAGKAESLYNETFGTRFPENGDARTMCITIPEVRNTAQNMDGFLETGAEHLGKAVLALQQAVSELEKYNEDLSYAVSMAGGAEVKATAIHTAGSHYLQGLCTPQETGEPIQP